MQSGEEVDEYTPGQLMKMGAVYDFLARLLPTEGRDYSLQFMFKDGNGVSVKFIPHTAFGKVWCDHCMEEMKKQRESR